MSLDGTQITCRPKDPLQFKQTGSEIGASVPISHADRNGPPGITPRAGSIHPGIKTSSRLPEKNLMFTVSGWLTSKSKLHGAIAGERITHDGWRL